MRSRKNMRWQDMDKGVIRLQDLIQNFDIYNRSDGKSPYTLNWYQQTLNTFLGWLIDTGRPVTLGSVDESIVREFILWFQQRRVRGHEISVLSINNRVRGLRAFFNWLFKNGYTETHLLQGVKPPRIPQVMVDTLSDKEITDIMASLDQSTMTGSRNTAMLALFLDSGVRLSELVGLTIQDVHIEDQYIKVMGKGSKERMVAFGSSARITLLHYLIHFRGEPANPSIENFFLTIDGYSMSREGVVSIMRRVGTAGGVPRLHAHLCRHTYATNFLIKSGNVLLLKQNLGHTTLAMVDRYVHLATSKVAVLSRSYSPLDKLNIRGLRRGGNGDKGNRRNGIQVFQRHSGYVSPRKNKY